MHGIQQNCPDVPSPCLYGFELFTGQTFTVLDNLPFIACAIQALRCRWLKFLGYPIPSHYIQHQSWEKCTLNTDYLLIEYIELSRGEMLSNT
ncbi:hypothetical protein I7I48_10432 [Histoplasma ohiense]|nr:hypothetical protein I7I48_10432 [Histoplasma ohiense (nom. inval.)]